MTVKVAAVVLDRLDVHVATMRSHELSLGKRVKQQYVYFTVSTEMQ